MNQENQDIKSITYYLPQLASKIQPVMSIVLISDGTNISRGVAIKNPKDNFNKKLGRAIADGRAKKAFYSQETCTKNNIRRKDVKTKIPWSFTNKCSFMPSLTIYEKQLLARLDQVAA